MQAIILLALCLAAVSAGPFKSQNKIIGGSVTTISSYPEIASLLYNWKDSTYSQACGGSIMNQRSILTAAHCFDHGWNSPARWRVRVGSTWANSGGVVHNTNQLIVHPNYNSKTIDSDIAILRTSTRITYVNNAVQPASISGLNYNLADNSVVWAAGWGVTETGWPSEQLRHVQMWTVSQAVCRQRYGISDITDNMLCAGWLDVGGRDQCQGDSGGPLYHNRVIVGICSWGDGCALAYYPGVNVRVSRFAEWIQANN